MARQSWELLVWQYLCRCLLFARPITFAAREIRTSGHLVETQSLDAACGARHRLVSSRPRKRARWDLVEVAASRTEEDDRTFPCDNCFDGESIRQCERVPTLFTRAADHPRWVETHLRQVLQSVGGYHDALACFWSAGTGTLRWLA